MNTRYILILLTSLFCTQLAIAQEDTQTPTERLLEGVQDSKTTPEIISALIKAGAEVNAKDNGGRSPLIVAAEYNNNPEICTLLIQARQSNK